MSSMRGVECVRHVSSRTKDRTNRESNAPRNPRKHPESCVKWVIEDAHHVQGESESPTTGEVPCFSRGKRTTCRGHRRGHGQSNLPNQRERIRLSPRVLARLRLLHWKHRIVALDERRVISRLRTRYSSVSTVELAPSAFLHVIPPVLYTHESCINMFANDEESTSADQGGSVTYGSPLSSTWRD